MESFGAESLELLTLFKELGYFGLLVAVLWYGGFKALPRAIQALDSNTKALKGLAEHNDITHQMLISVISKQNRVVILFLIELGYRLQWHEATIRGVNPSSGKDVEERLAGAVETFKRAQGSTEKLESEVKRLFSDIDDEVKRVLLYMVEKSKSKE